VEKRVGKNLWGYLGEKKGVTGGGQPRLSECSNSTVGRTWPGG